jgi:protein O-mannosyl-transferase
MKRDEKHQHPQPARQPPQKAEKGAGPYRWKYPAALALIVLISFLAYLPVLHNSLLGWDDDGYIRNNPMVYSMNLREIFSRFVLGNYHPVTILAFAAEFRCFGLNETGYHAVNLLLHLANVILVFYVVHLLSGKAGVALVASLLFGVHPVHVESVAWAAELKDLLYTFFFLASCICYLKYLKEFQKKYYLFALLLFAFSLLSKAMAASLPLVLVLTDYFTGRKTTIKTILEKVPFFLLALALGMVAVIAQKASDSIPSTAIAAFPQRLIFACYGFVSYLLKLLLPLNLSAFYPYPARGGPGIPTRFYLYVIVFLGLIVSVIFSSRFTRKIVFGFGFFLVTVILVLQLFPVGYAIMADRYCYLPSIGIFYLAGEGFHLIWGKKLKWAAIVTLSLFTVFFSVKTYARCRIWINDMTLWNDVIRQSKTVERAYNNRGALFYKERKNDRALEDFNQAIELSPDYAEAFNNRGNLFMNEQKYDEALGDFNKAIELKPGFPVAFFNRGTLFYNEKRINEALNDFNKAIELNPGYSDAYNLRGDLLYNEKRINEALDDFNKAIVLSPGDVAAYNNRGNLFMNAGRADAALSDFNAAIELQPGYATTYNNRGTLFYLEKSNDKALKDFDNAIELKPDYLLALLNRGILLYSEKRYEEAIRTYSKAIALNAGYAEAYYGRGSAEYYSGNNDAACRDMKQAATLGYKPAEVVLLQICK